MRVWIICASASLAALNAGCSRCESRLSLFSLDDEAAIYEDERARETKWGISGNTLANEILDSLLPAFLDDNVAIFYAEDGYRLVEEHRNILKYLKDHDPEQAEKFMQEHIARVINEVESMQNSSRS